MTWTDYAGLAGLAAAALLATWLFLGAGNTTTPHRNNNPRHSTPATPQPPRHRRTRR